MKEKCNGYTKYPKIKVRTAEIYHFQSETESYLMKETLSYFFISRLINYMKIAENQNLPSVTDKNANLIENGRTKRDYKDNLHCMQPFSGRCSRMLRNIGSIIATTASRLFGSSTSVGLRSQVAFGEMDTD
ncbi:hypothetical protein T01_9548 [Trichinella spiralis]|uniref:Uncharacterized protein n=1 Tax=Trichinella spiralis TaxID=6334 RepID=A0A0V1B4X1_TRISP|nr:hypothetical protein T01_9548 [Trichinella spiralis]